MSPKRPVVIVVLACLDFVLGLVLIVGVGFGVSELNQSVDGTPIGFLALFLVMAILFVASGIALLRRQAHGPYVQLAATVLAVGSVALPNLVRRHPPFNETVALGTLRTIVAAEDEYARSNSGYYDTLACLTEPARCIPDHPVVEPTANDRRQYLQPKPAGYVFAFYAGPPVIDRDPAHTSPSSLRAYAYVAVPRKYGRTGVRTFCADSTGKVCSSLEVLSPVRDGACPSDCRPLL
jgi:hypothetical protein